MMLARHRPRQCHLPVSSDSDEVPLSELTKTTPGRTGDVSDDMAGSYSNFKPRVTSTPKVFDNLKPDSRNRSERLKRRRASVFHMPSRKEVFDRIDESPKKRYSHLQPRSLVNNYLKERHRYNYDHASTSGESSIDEFIVDDNDAETGSDDEDIEEELQLTAFKQTRVSCLHSSEDEDEESDMVQTRRTTRHTRRRSRGDISHMSTNKRRNSALESDSSDSGNSETEDVSPVTKRSQRSILVDTSSDDDDAAEMTSTKNMRDHPVDSGVDSTRFEDSRTNTTGDIANMRLGCTDCVSGSGGVVSCDSVVSHDTCHSVGSDAESDDSCVRVSARRKSRRRDIVTDDSDSQLEAGSSSLEGDVGRRDEGGREASERVQTLAQRKRHRESVITAYRLQRVKHLK